ncbi:tRNA (guanosine(37)-N1)-methyltransferase TrmD [Candidatus Collierbacteria bacterium RIFCSPLOWO2_01_FULL_50_23]|uniref:tRNA (guanine-N(1)-)-methyltransferase n=2 Tax=Candidatus Collieribacteriota TaxID=1752725 RepID=A0A1F5EVP7_9BACT|nr:MAG: tRNA (guanosine(37)-N1)-methyltransferase TrmD [Candidatus Collierbacteria bacterium RIFCSPHIGHO2_02_FULL_49_10]OGD71962.1 MAG: tRNA (guanosine(37)-N1)-methyltransferase TrmD [Candidatus Collierbacteria bacterium RIFCSPHIGHO2_01_FULL_50_25]OGD74881.1 MAG: tRNA (guanosine(37)-N1)-methyltransferase TrmD [Candidatus Collierbacteria bacterium RIFCSPLOWO2_01_FULL_50_23]
MKIDILTIFPEMFSPLMESIMKRAQVKGLVEIKVHNLRDWSTDKHKSVDASPYGGGPGMVMRVDVVDRAVEALAGENTRVVLMDTKGPVYTQKKAEELKEYKHMVIIAPHYEGIDHRVHEHIANEVISIGEYVLTGGEIPAMVVVDSIVRLLPGVLGNEASLAEESYQEEGEIEYPQYTRPEEYKGWKVPEILLSGHHAKINDWRKKS